MAVSAAGWGWSISRKTVGSLGAEQADTFLYVTGAGKTRGQDRICSLQSLALLIKHFEARLRIHFFLSLLLPLLSRSSKLHSQLTQLPAASSLFSEVTVLT